jgi:GNAT superfamily N-acetyltransferase
MAGMGVQRDRALSIRTMRAGEASVAASIGAEVGWRGLGRQVEFLSRHPLCEAVAAEAGGEVVGEVVGVGFGTRNGGTGWVGLVCVRPAYQGRGLGTRITADVVSRLEGRGCRTTVLTATRMGRPVYERLGFSTETLYHGFDGPGLGAEELPPAVRPMVPEDLPAVGDLDRRLTGEDRAHLLRALEGPGWVAVDADGKPLGYHLPVPWGGGPIIAEDPDAAWALTRLVRILAGPDGIVRFWLASENEEGRERMRELGFEEARVVPRMIRGEPLSWRPEALWGLFSLAKG